MCVHFVAEIIARDIVKYIRKEVDILFDRVNVLTHN